MPSVRLHQNRFSEHSGRNNSQLFNPSPLKKFLNPGDKSVRLSRQRLRKHLSIGLISDLEFQHSHLIYGFFMSQQKAQDFIDRWLGGG